MDLFPVLMLALYFFVLLALIGAVLSFDSKRRGPQE